MPIRFAQANGLWSSVATWNGGTTVPTASDQVFANNRTIIVDVSPTVEFVSNQATGSAVIGGTFILTNGITFTATDPTMGFRPYQFATSASLLQISQSNSATIIGSLVNPNTGFGNSLIGVTVDVSGSASLTITGSVSGNKAGQSGIGIRHQSTGTLRILGNLLAGPGGSNENNNHGVLATNTGTTIIQGNVSTYAVGGGATHRAIAIAAAHNLFITGSVYADPASAILNTTGNGNIYISGSVERRGTDTAAAITKTTAGTIEVIGPVIGNGIILSTSTTATNRFTGPLIKTTYNNVPAFVGPRIQFIAGSTPYVTLQTDTFNQLLTFYDTSYTSSVPDQPNVRSGSLYGGSNQFSGSMVVPATSSVRYGVPVDNTTGSAIVTPATIFDSLLTSLTASNSIGERLKNISTIQTTAATIAAFKGK